VGMRMMRHRRTPGVQHGDDTDPRAEDLPLTPPVSPWRGSL
jgi:hypothetical protein